MPASASSAMMHSATQSGGATRLSVTPSVALVDDPVHITVTGLRSKQPVTLTAAVNESGGKKNCGKFREMGES